MDTVREPLLVLDRSLKILSANRSFYETFGLGIADTEGRPLYEISGGAWDMPELRQLMENTIRKQDFFKDFFVEQDFPELGRRRFLLNTRRLADQGRDQEKILLAIADPPPDFDPPQRKGGPNGR